MKLKKIAVGIVCGAMLLTATPALAAQDVEASVMMPAIRLVSMNLNGQVPNTQGVLYANQAWVPLRAAADGLGIAVSWDGETRTAVINDGTRGMNFYEGENLYTSYCTIPGLVGMPAPRELAGPPKIAEDGRMWVPAEAFAVLIGYDVTVADDVISISKTEKAEVDE